MTVNEEFVVILDFVNTMFILLAPAVMVTNWKVQPQNLVDVTENLLTEFVMQQNFTTGYQFIKVLFITLIYTDSLTLTSMYNTVLLQIYTYDTHKGETT